MIKDMWNGTVNGTKAFFKELKRVRWPNGKESSKTFWGVLIFVVVTGLVLFGLAIGLTELWNMWGVGING